MKLTIKAGIILLVSALCAAQASAQTIKIGSVLTLSGPNATLGENMDRAIKLYMKLNQDKLPPGVKVEVITRDDGELTHCGNDFLMRQTSCIGGGTTEMARNVISERVLGMPRERTLDRDVTFREVPRSSSR